MLLMVSLVATLLASSVFAVDPPKPPTVPPTPVPTVIEGPITAITVATPNTGTITIAPAPSPIAGAPVKPPVTFSVNEKTKIVKDGTAVTLGALVVGDACRAMVVKTDAGLVAQIVYATTVVPPVRVAKGRIADKALWNGQRTFKLAVPPVGMGPTLLMWFSVDSATKITVDGKAANYDRLANGQAAEVGYRQPPPSLTPVELPILAASVSATNPPPPPAIRIVGKLVAIDPAAGTIAVLLRPTMIAAPVPAPVVLKITDATTINKFGPARMDALVLGDSVEAAYRPNVDASTTTPPVAISVAVQPESFVGIVDRVVPGSAIGTGTLWIGQRLTSGAVVAPVPFKVVEATRITRNGVQASLAQIVKGDLAALKYFQFRDGKVASVVEARGLITR